MTDDGAMTSTRKRLFDITRLRWRHWREGHLLEWHRADVTFIEGGECWIGECGRCDLIVVR